MPNKKKKKNAFFYYAPALVWMGVIFYFSSIPGLTKTTNPDIWFYVVRKGAHVLEYFVLALLFFNLLRFYKLKKRDVLLLVFLFSLNYAFSDEIHQLFVLGREGKFSDVGIDLVGIALTILLGVLFWKTEFKKRQLRKK